MSLGRNLTMLCYDKKVTQVELAEAAGCSQKMISKIMLGECMPSVRILVSIAKYLDVSTDELLWLANGMNH